MYYVRRAIHTSQSMSRFVANAKFKQPSVKERLANIRNMEKEDKRGMFMSTPSIPASATAMDERPVVGQLMMYDYEVDGLGDHGDQTRRYKGSRIAAQADVDEWDVAHGVYVPVRTGEYWKEETYDTPGFSTVEKTGKGSWVSY